jgi:hypothetical protein
MDPETRWEFCEPLELVEECYGEGCKDYRGYQSQTVGGAECQPWAMQEPQEHGFDPSAYPDAGLEGNYCRNPSADDSIWCYTMDPEVRWDYCAPILNTEECTGEGCANYRGFQTYTTSGRQCQAWTE